MSLRNPLSAIAEAASLLQRASIPTEKKEHFAKVIQRQTAAMAVLLVADDNVDAAQTLAARLELEGYRVHLAADGVAGLELAKTIRFGACFLDIGMPRMNGYDLAEQLRQLAGGSQLLLVAITGWGQAEDKRRALEAGVDVHITKPVDVDEACEVLAQRETG